MCGAHEYYIHAHQFMNLRSDQNYFLEKKENRANYKKEKRKKKGL
jgi:hypothetical protein